MSKVLKAIKGFFHKPERKIEQPQTTETPKTTVKVNDLSVFATPEGQGRWALVIGAEGQGKTYMVKEVAAKIGKFAYVEAPEFQPTKNVDLFVIDDLHKATPQKLAEIFQFLCGARHENIKNVICVTQELKGIPSEVVRRFKVVAFFYSAKQTMKIQTLVKGGLKEASAMADKIIRLLPRTYYLYDVQTGLFKNPPLPNTETSLLMKGLSDVLPNITEKPISDKITLENGEKVKRQDVKITPLIIKTLKDHPEFKYAYIAEQYGTTVDYVKKVASRWQRGLTKYS